MKRIIVAGLALSMVLGLTACDGGKTGHGSSPGDSSEQQERTEVLTLKLGSLGSGRKDDCSYYPISKFIEVVEEKTDGMIQIKYFPGGQLGGEPEMLDQVVTDSLDIAVLSANVLATIWPEFYAYNLPFAFDDLEQLWDICGFEASNFYDVMKDTVDGSGWAHFISSFSAEFRGCQNTKHPIRTPDDFKGLTFRVMAGEVFTDIFRGLGASTATVTFSELYTGLQQGIIDGEDVSLSMFYDQKFNEVEGYATQFNITPTVNPLLISNGAYNKLTAAEIEIFKEAAKEAEKASYDYVSKSTTKYVDLCRETRVEVITRDELTEDEIQACRDALAPMWEKYKSVVGDEAYNALTVLTGRA